MNMTGIVMERIKRIVAESNILFDVRKKAVKSNISTRAKPAS
ncbi:hypothetical protein MTBBW1_2030085 [Desulfamplus magnetovallimortis]|uniref:Uncharacterized protein n=1 Tax=Desulfamplus magnetovallimortis TaxID=1246637 RepID=A0A1W1HC83_9BACT|nr:hypothetical protein MTBBW1_2030085 [Desulfamplus magnetovallimortis]